MNKSRFVVKPQVIDMMAARFPEYPYAFSKDPRYFFRSEAMDRIHEYVVFQRDGQSGAFYVDLAATYDPEWRGFEPYPLGRWESLAKLVKAGKKEYIDALENWYFYSNSQEKLRAVLDQIASHLASHGKPYFLRVRKLLQSDRVLQAGLRALREREPVSKEVLLGLDHDLEGANHLLPDTENAALDQMARDIRERLSLLARFRAEEKYVRKVACQLLFLGRRKELRGIS